tara:strand:+ start:391 stop:714 length:324 start_codon:yes stop_codon:yes gene_type:complete
MSDKKELREINLDAITSGVNQTVTIDSNTPLSAHQTDVITLDSSESTITVDGVPLIDMAQIDPNSYQAIEFAPMNELQGDLFNGWPEDGEPVTVTITTLQEDDGYND